MIHQSLFISSSIEESKSRINTVGNEILLHYEDEL